MPLVAVVASVGLQVDAVDGPRDLGGLLGLGLGAVTLLGGALFGEVRGHASEWSRLETGATTAGFHGR